MSQKLESVGWFCVDVNALPAGRSKRPAQVQQPTANQPPIRHTDTPTTRQLDPAPHSFIHVVSQKPSSIHPSTHSFIHPSIHSSIHPFIHPFIQLQSSFNQSIQYPRTSVRHLTSDPLRFILNPNSSNKCRNSDVTLFDRDEF
jgi:hypothetical protein